MFNIPFNGDSRGIPMRGGLANHRRRNGGSGTISGSLFGPRSATYDTMNSGLHAGGVPYSPTTSPHAHLNGGGGGQMNPMAGLNPIKRGRRARGGSPFTAIPDSRALVPFIEAPGVSAGSAGGSSATRRLSGSIPQRFARGASSAIGWGSGTNFAGREFANGVGGKLTYGRAGLVGGLGLLAAANTFKTVERARYGDYGHAALNAGLATAAAGGAYAAFMHKGAFSNHFRNAASFLVKQMRRI